MALVNKSIHGGWGVKLQLMSNGCTFVTRVQSVGVSEDWGYNRGVEKYAFWLDTPIHKCTVYPGTLMFLNSMLHISLLLVIEMGNGVFKWDY